MWVSGKTAVMRCLVTMGSSAFPGLDDCTALMKMHECVLEFDLPVFMTSFWWCHLNQVLSTHRCTMSLKRLPCFLYVRVVKMSRLLTISQ